jgi:hypothetical protein
MKDAKTQIRRDLVFLVSGIPDHLHICDNTHSFARLGENELKSLSKISEKHKELKGWLDRWNGKICAVIFRNEFETEAEAFECAHMMVSSMLDGFIFLTGDTTPTLSEFVMIRTQDEPDARYAFFLTRGWIKWGTLGPVAEKEWSERSVALRQKLLAFFDAVSVPNSSLRTDLANQLGFSARIFRHGQQATTYDIEYLCKFTALEGLVCGDKRPYRGSLFKNNLLKLFPALEGLDEKADRLWKKRCGASHQGKIPPDELSIEINYVERLLMGVIVFALDNIKTAKTVEELWGMAGGYHLPPNVAMPPPQHMGAIQNFIQPLGHWRGAGRTIDHVFAQVAIERSVGQSPS